MYKFLTAYLLPEQSSHRLFKEVRALLVKDGVPGEFFFVRSDINLEMAKVEVYKKVE